MRRSAALLAALGICLALPAGAAARGPALSADLLLDRLVNPLSALEPLPAPVKNVLVSSHDRTGGNLDGGSTTGPLAQLNVVPPSMVRRDRQGYVLMEFSQPGCLTRLFMGGGGIPVGTAAGFGRIQMTIDGASRPAFDEGADHLFKGGDPKYPQPLVADYFVSSGANYSYVPVCFRHSLTVHATSLPPDPLGYWQANVMLAPKGTPVVPFDPNQSMKAAARKLGGASAEPPRAPDFRAGDVLGAGDRLKVANLKGAGTVRHLQFKVTPFDIHTLNGLSLRIRADRGGSPQVDVPLAGAFGDTIETREIVSKAFGMSPEKGTGYLALPAPFRKGARVEVGSDDVQARVKVRGWRGPEAPGDQQLFGDHHVETPAIGSDTRVLDAGGSGRLASLVTDDIDGGPVSNGAPLQRFLEGDERVHVDGARSPTYYGTGHEEINNGGFYYIYGAYSGPLGGAGLLGKGEGTAGTQNQYRVFGDEGPLWEREIAFGLEHGGGDEQPQVVALTTFSYRGARRLKVSDTLEVGSESSERRHHLAGMAHQTMTHYFEGERDGNGTLSTIVVGGSLYPAPPPEQSRESFTAAGVRFNQPITLQMKVAPGNRGIVLRGLFDQAPPLVPLRVKVDGAGAGIWTSPTAIANPSKRWLEDDFQVPERLTAGKRRVELKLSPVQGTGNLFGLSTLSRTR